MLFRLRRGNTPTPNCFPREQSRWKVKVRHRVRKSTKSHLQIVETAVKAASPVLYTFRPFVSVILPSTAYSSMAASLLPVSPKPYIAAQTVAGSIAGSRAAFAPRVGIGGAPLRRVRATAAVAEGARVSGGVRKDEKPIIVVDNYDSFTYNLCQYIGELGANFEVHRNDELTVDEIKRKNPRGILISPGPGTPQDSGISLQTVLELGPSIPLFGVCMGLQCMGEAFGGRIVRSPSGVVHGKSSLVYYDEKQQDTLFFGLPNPFTAGRYHSLVIEKDSFPSNELEITAWTEDGLIMAARHKKYRHIQGVQFHPESIITTEGKTMVHNFIKLIDRFEAAEPQN